MLAGAGDHLAIFSFSRVSQTIVEHSTWEQCPQVLAGKARKVAKSTRLCSYTGCSCDTPATHSELRSEPRQGCSYTVERDRGGVASAPLPFDRKFLHYITLFFRINYVWCNVIIYIDNGLWINLLVPTLCRAELGWIFYFGPANFRKIAGEFLSEFWWRILIANFSALFFQGFRPPKKFTPKIHVQKCRHSSPISLFLNPKFIHGDFLLTGETKIYRRCNSGRCTTGSLPSAWNTKITLHQSFGN